MTMTSNKIQCIPVTLFKPMGCIHVTPQSCLQHFVKSGQRESSMQAIKQTASKGVMDALSGQ